MPDCNLKTDGEKVKKLIEIPPGFKDRRVSHSNVSPQPSPLPRQKFQLLVLN